MTILQMLQQAQAFLTQKNYEKVIEITSDVLMLKSVDLEKSKRGTTSDGERLFALQLRCAAYFGQRYYADALSDAEILIQLLPNEAVGYYHRGAALLQFDEIDAAKADFNHLLSLQLPPSVQCGIYHSLGLADYISGHYESALQYYEQAIQASPAEETTGSIYGNIGIVYFRQNDMAAAWNAYKTARHLNPSHDHILMGLAVLHAAEGQWNEALTLWRTLAAQHPFFTDIDEVVERYYHWTPPMADLVRQIAAKANA